MYKKRIYCIKYYGLFYWYGFIDVGEGLEFFFCIRIFDEVLFDVV